MPQTQKLALVDVDPPAMSWWDRTKRAVRSFTSGPYSTRDPELAKLFNYGYQTKSGIHVTDAIAMTYSGVFGAVWQLSNDVAKLPLEVRKYLQNGGSEEYTASPLYKLLKFEANPEMSAMEFRRTLTAHAMTTHGGYAEIQRNGAGVPVALWPLEPHRVRPIREKVRDARGIERFGPLKWEVDASVVLDDHDMLNIHNLGYTGRTGYPVIQQARQAIGLALAAEGFGASFFGTGSTFGGILSTDLDLDEDQARAFRELIEKYHQSTDRSFRNLVLSGGWKFTPTGVKPQESQMDELRNRQLSEVALFFGMPPHKLGVTGPGALSSYASVEVADLAYYKGPVHNWTKTWEQELVRKLIPRLEWSQQYIKHNANAMLMADHKARGEFYKLMHDMGAMNADEIRALEDMNPQPGGIGKMYLVQGAQVPKQQIADVYAAKIAKDKADAEATSNPAPPAPATDGVDAANVRAVAAETIAAEMRAKAEQERELRIAAEASGTATMEALEQLRAAELAQQQIAVQAQSIAEGLRAEAMQRQAALDAANEALLAAAEAKGASEARAISAEQQAADAKAEADEWARRSADSQAVAEAARKEADDAVAASVAATAAQHAAEARAQTAQQEAKKAAGDSLAMEALLGVANSTLASERAAVERLTAAMATADEAFGVEREGLARSVESRQEELRDARRRVSEAEEERNRLQAEADAAREDAASTKAACVLTADEAVAKAQAAEEARAKEVSAREAAEAATAQALADANELRMSLASVQAERDLAIGQSQARAEAIEVERRRIAALEQRQQELTATEQTLSVTIGEQNATIAALRASSAQVDAELQQARAAFLAEQRDLSDTREATRENAAAVLAAHRALIVDVMRRTVEREVEVLKPKAQSREKLEASLTRFYDGHSELCQRALLPAVRIHLAWTGSSEDPVDLTRRLVERHVQESIRQVRTVLDGDSQDLALSFNGLFRRWESERVDTIADVLLQRGIDHARSRS